MVQVTVEQIVLETVAYHRGKTRYRRPLVGVASAQDPAFDRLCRLVPGHLRPEDLLAGARSVVAFFLPFHQDIVQANAEAELCADEWGLAYAETNRLLLTVCQALGESLRAEGFRAAWQSPTYEFDHVTLTANWSHKSMGWLAGLGTFGVHRLLITAAGCAGRVGSLVTDATLPPTPRSSVGALCSGRMCYGCVEKCPVGALTARGFDRQACYRRLLEVDRYLSARLPREQGPYDVCGKCATGPCATEPCALASRS
ncbi:MAG TPA: epoxyqueuosine reductase [Firmicutes bacterium]|nr:epoxyqueuosine reductase [Bacillota bacterium]